MVINLIKILFKPFSVLLTIRVTEANLRGVIWIVDLEYE